MPENLVIFPPASNRTPIAIRRTCAVFLDEWNGTDVAEAARELSGRLPEHVPGALRLVIARALRQLDLPPFASVTEFRDAVARFAARPIELRTISDVRRARRARRTTLVRIAEQTGLPVSVLRQLEWGDFREWRDANATERTVAAYARAAELDEQRVLSIVAAERDTQLIRWPGTPTVSEGTSGGERLSRKRAVTAAAVLLVSVGIVGAVLERDQRPVRTDGTAGPAVPAVTETGQRVSVAPMATRETPASASSAPPPLERTLPDAPVKPLLSNVTQKRAATFSPAFSSAGSAMFYPHGDATGDLRVFTVVEGGARNYHVRPSPDGTRIAFDSDRDGDRGVYLATADGRDVRRVSGPGFAAVPSWSPDGTHLAYVRAEEDRRTWNLWLLDLRTQEVRRLTSNGYGQPWGASWFPDGRRIAYAHDDGLKILNLETRVTRTFKTPHAGRLVQTPAVSPDGRYVAFQVSRDGAWLLDMRDGSMQRILTDPTAEEFAWDAEGRRLAFHSGRSGQWSVWIMAPQS